MTDAPGPEQFVVVQTEHNPGVLVGRRAVVVGATAAVATLAAGLAPEALGRPTEVPHEEGPPGGPEGPQSESLEAQHGAETSEKHTINDNTATAMTLLFGGLVAGNIAGKQPFTRQTVKLAWGAEAARLTALKVGGDQHAFKHDMHEFFAHKPHEGEIGSVLFWGLLPVMADVASAVKIDLDGIRKEGYKDPEADAVAHEVVNELLEVAAVLPDISAPTEVWEEFEGAAKDAFVEAFSVGTGAGMAGPAGTTYLGAKVGSETLREMYTRSYNHEVAKVVLGARQNGVELSETDAKRNAITNANKLMKGAMKFMVAIHCNALGSFGLGDPPEAVFDLSHMSDPKAIAKSQAVGFGLAEAATAVNAVTFLASHGYVKDIPSSLGQIAKGQKNVATALARSIFDKNIRQESWGGSKMTAENIVKAIDERYADTEVSEASIERIKELVRGIPQPTIEMDARSFMRTKLDYILDRAEDSKLTSWLMQTGIFMASANDVANGGVERGLNLQPELAADASFIQQFAIREGETKREYVTRVMGNVEGRAREDVKDKTSDIANVFESMIRVDENDGLEARVNDVLPIAIINRKGLKGELRSKRLAGQISQKAYDLISSNGAVTADNIGEVLEIYGVLTGADVTMIRHAIVQASDSYHGIKADEEHPNTFLSEEGEEVFTALGTQIPFVPSLVHSAERALEKIESFEDKVNAVLELTVGVSTFGDNVAAQLFAISVLSNLYREEMGAEAFDGNKELQVNIAIAATKLAEAAGALSLIGNGPNFVIRGTQGELNEETGQLETHETKYEMAPSLLNAYAVNQTVVTFIAMKQLIKSAIDPNVEFALAA